LFSAFVEFVLMLIAAKTTTKQEKQAREVRRLHIICLFSNMGGSAEHPRLISVLHLAQNDVYLRRN